MLDPKDFEPKLEKWFKDWFEKNGKDSPMVIGVSGGKDSTVCLKLGIKYLGKDRVVPVLMPNGTQADIQDSIDICKEFGVEPITVNIGPAYDALFDAINIGKDLNECKVYTTNTPARLRMATLYGIAAAVNGRVVNTCNLSESIVGWETYGGDGFGDFAPIGKLTKTEVVALGDYLGINQKWTHKTPSDGMCGATDEDKLGFTYETLDNYIRKGIMPKAKETLDRIMFLHKKSHFKHENIRIPTCEIGALICEDFDWD